MSKQIETLKLALEALENTTPTGFNMERDKQFFVAITAIKEALAQPTTGDYALGYAEGFNDACKKPAQPPVAKPHEQEPIQRYSPDGNGGMEIDSLGAWVKFTSPPPQLKPLTDEEIMELLMPVRIFGDGYYLRIARAIESAHGIKE